MNSVDFSNRQETISHFHFLPHCPWAAMAASASTPPEAFVFSSSSSHLSWTYDVFLSFRGEDTRKRFTDHLYGALIDAGINAFIDNEGLERGEDIPSGLLSAIQGSRISVIVFSENYASSRWCLKELVQIMECHKGGRQLVVPIFYLVDPSDVRHQTGSFAKAFEEHEKRYLIDMDEVRRWREALREAANLAGMHLYGDKSEATFIRDIVENISKEVNTTLFVALHPVGIDPRVKEVASLLCLEVEAVRMVGIWGMGGIGKTSLSKAIYNEFLHRFQGKSFIANVRETCKQFHGQVRLQKQLLSDTLRTSKTKINSVDIGITIIKERLRQRRVLVILDDVDQLEQVNAIVGNRDWFGLGSRIIITTRNEQLLKVLKVDAIYTAREMNDNESLELFSKHAFGSSYPIEGYVDLSRSVVAYSGGLPLALEVLGSYLHTMSLPKWKGALEKLKRIPHDKIQEKLRISFDALGDIEKNIFLDIACFFIGMGKNYVNQILDGCDFFAESGIIILIERCLLSVDQGDKLRMHDLLHDMGREIVRQEDTKLPGNRSRVWLHKDAFDILAKHKGKEAVEGLALKLPRESNVHFYTRAFKEMERLRLLQLDHVRLIGDYKHLSEELRWLRWHEFPLEFMPKNFYPRDLVAIDLQHSNLRRVWKIDEQLLEKLKFLNLSHSHFLTKTPNFGRLPNLEELVLKDCMSLFEVHESIGDLRNLVLANFKGCKILESLPRSLYKMKSLQTLILSGCSKFDNLPGELGEMESLTNLLANDTAIRHVPCTIIKLKNLKYVSLWEHTGSGARYIYSTFLSCTLPRRSSSSVNTLCASLQGLNSIRELCLRGCTLSNDGILKDLLILRSLGFSELRTLTLDYSTKPQFILSFDKLSKSNAMILEEGCSNIINTSSQSIFQECAMVGIGGGFGTFLIGNDLPDWFMYKGDGSSICFEVPWSIYRDLEGFIVRVVYSICVEKTTAKDLPSMVVINSTKNMIQIKQPITVDEVIFHEDHIWEGNVPQSSFNIEAGDKVKVIVDFGSRVIVQKIGVCLVYDSIVHGKMHDYDSTSNTNAIVVNDDDAAPKDQVTIKFERSCSDANTESSHSGFCDGREAKRLRRENNIDD